MRWSKSFHFAVCLLRAGRILINELLLPVYVGKSVPRFGEHALVLVRLGALQARGIALQEHLALPRRLWRLSQDLRAQMTIEELLQLARFFPFQATKCVFSLARIRTLSAYMAHVFLERLLVFFKSLCSAFCFSFFRVELGNRSLEACYSFLLKN